MSIFGNFPSVDTGVTMLIFIMMALGLNIVVGYAGLLDLGYVAFYAMGAYTAAWFASQHFSTVTLHLGGVGVGPEAPGIHVSIWLVLLVAGSSRRLVGIIIGFPTLRLRGDYLAIVTLGFGEIMPQVANNGDHLPRVQRHERAAGHQPDRPARFRRHPAQRRWPADGLPELTEQHPALLLDCARARPVHGLLLGPAARLAAGTRLDRDP